MALNQPNISRPLLLRNLLGGSCLLFAVALVGQRFVSGVPVQASAQSDHAPSGWFLAGSKPENYRTGIAREVVQNGQPSAYLTSAVPVTEGFGTLMQSINATNYVGKRVRLRASVHSKDVTGWAGMWMRVDGVQTALSFDNMLSRSITGTQPWRTYDVVLDVPSSATSISFGVLLNGSGEVWANHVTFEPVGKDVDITGSATYQRSLSAVPVNLNFSE